MQETLQVVTPPSTLPVTLEVCKVQCRVDASITTEDGYITSLIGVATEHAEKILKMSLVNRTYAWSFDYFPNRIVLANGLTIGSSWLNSRLYPYTQAQILYLPKPPLVSVTSVQYVDENGNTQTVADYQCPGVQNGPVIPGRIAPLPGQIWPATQDALGAITVTYVAGFGFLEDGITPNVPQGIQYAIQAMVGELWINREVSTDQTLNALPLSVTQLLNANKYGFYT